MMRAEKRQEWDWPGYWKGDGCMEGLARLSGLCSRIMYALFIALLAELVIHFALSNEEALGTLALCLVGLTAGRGTDGDGKDIAPVVVPVFCGKARLGAACAD